MSGYLRENFVLENKADTFVTAGSRTHGTTDHGEDIVDGVDDEDKKSVGGLSHVILSGAAKSANSKGNEKSGSRGGERTGEKIMARMRHVMRTLNSPWQRERESE
eukprot:590238-Rhodomonas_salina.2